MKLVPLSEAAEIAMGSAPPSASYNESREGIPMIAGAGDFGDFYPTPKKWTTETTRLAAKGDLLVCVRATIGDLNWADRDYCLGRGVAGLRAKGKQADIRYIARVLEARKSDLSRLGSGSTFLAIRKSELETFQIPLPPLDEQRRIAAVLDRADSLRRQRRESVRHVEKLLQSVFIDMFGDLTANPKRWEQVPLEDLCEKIVDCPHSTPVYCESLTGFYCVRSSDIQNGKLDLASARQVSEVVFAERIARHEPKAGEVIYTREGGRLGYAAQVPEGKKICLGQRMMLFSGESDVASNAFLNGLLNSESFRRVVLNLVGGGAAPRVNIKDLKSIVVYRPPMSTQLRYEHFATELGTEEQFLVDSETLINKLFSSIQQRAFRGELDLSRLALNPEGEAPIVAEPEKPVSLAPRSEAALFLKAPGSIEPELKKLDETVSKGEPIPWSADYFKYRILGGQFAPFSFSDLTAKAESVFEEPPPYEEVKGIILELLGQDGGPARLRQRFDLHVDASTKETSGRKEIVFELGP